MSSYGINIDYNKVKEARQTLRNIATNYASASITKQKYTSECGKLGDLSGSNLKHSIVYADKVSLPLYVEFHSRLLEKINRPKIYVKGYTKINGECEFTAPVLGIATVHKETKKGVLSNTIEFDIPKTQDIYDNKNLNISAIVLNKDDSKKLYDYVIATRNKGFLYVNGFTEIYSVIQELAAELKQEAKNLKVILNKLKESEDDAKKSYTTDTNSTTKTSTYSNVSNNAKKSAATAAGLTVADLRKKIREALKEGKIKKANKLYDKLQKKAGKEKAREIAKKLIEKTGAKVTLQKGEFVKVKTNNPVNIAETGAVIVTSASPATVDFVSSAIKRETYFYEKQRAEEKEALYQTYIGKVSAIDSNSENAQELLDKYQKELDDSLADVDKKYDDLIANLKSEDYSSDLYANMTKEDIESDLATAQSDMAESVGEKISAGGAYSYNKSNKFADIQVASVNEVSPSINASTSTDPSTLTPPAVNNTPSNEAVATPVVPSNSNQNANATKTYTSNVVSGQRESAPTTSNSESSINQNQTESQPQTSNENSQIMGDQSNSNTIESDTEPDNITGNNEDIEDVISIPSINKNNSTKTDNKKSGLGVAIPIGLGVAATGAAAVAGVRYLKNKKQNEDVDYSYDDENNGDYSSVQSDSAYMQDDYLDSQDNNVQSNTLDNNQYTDSEEIEEELGTNKFVKDLALDDLN